MNREKDLFITGAPRSGTTLLYAIISSLTNYVCINEIYGLKTNSTKFIQKYRAEIFESLREQIGYTPTQSVLTYPDIIRDVGTQISTKTHNWCWCLKDPNLTSLLDIYGDAFPSAKFLIIYRDPRAVCRSLLDRSTFRLGRPKNVIAAAYKWKNDITQQLDFSRRHPQKCLLVKYENLLSNFEHSIETIASFIGTDERVNMLNYWNSNRIRTRIHAGNKNILLKPDPSLGSQWKRSLDPRQISRIESVLLAEMKHFNYPVISELPRSNLFVRLSSLLLDKAQREIEWQLNKTKYYSTSTGK